MYGSRPQGQAVDELEKEFYEEVVYYICLVAALIFRVSI